jgi:hypothetical protein
MAGQPTTYTEDLADRICKALAASEKGLRGTLKALSEEFDDIPHMDTVYEWARNNAQFSDKFAQAKRQQLEAMAEDIVDISMDDNLDPNDKRIRIDTRKWLLSKLMHRTYGDKLDLTSNGETLSTPAHIVDQRVQSIIMAARMRRLGNGQLTIEGLDDNALKLLD